MAEEWDQPTDSQLQLVDKYDKFQAHVCCLPRTRGMGLHPFLFGIWPHVDTLIAASKAILVDSAAHLHQWKIYHKHVWCGKPHKPPIRGWFMLGWGRSGLKFFESIFEHFGYAAQGRLVASVCETRWRFRIHIIYSQYMLYIYAYMYICIYVYMYICIYVYTYICIYVYM